MKTESGTVKIFAFNDRVCAKAKPGQFLMLWIPGVDEIPLSVLDAQDGAVSVAVRKVGEASRALHMKDEGDMVGVRGPFGNSFALHNGRILMVGGGTGIAPLFLLNRKLAGGSERIFVMGAKTKDELLLMKDLEAILSERKGKLVTTTEDGSCGIAGVCTDPLEQLLANKDFDMIYTCGPEKMMRKVCDLADQHKIPIEASLERLMRCAIGLCGSCAIGKYRVCKDGPVFSSAQLREIRGELGVSKLDAAGRRVPLT